MNYFECSGVDRSVLNYPTIAKANGAIAQFKTDLNRNLLHAICNFNATQASGTPTPATPLQINGISAVNVINCGVNLWDEQWELGSYDSMGQPKTSTSIIRSKNYIPCKNGATYYFKVPSGTAMVVFFYDKNHDYISDTTRTNQTYSAPANACFMRFRMSTQYGTTYNNDISINYPSTDTAYHAYNGTTAIINLGGTYYGGTVDAITGKITLTHSIKKFGELSWNSSTWGNFTAYSANLSDAKSNPTSTLAGLICEMYNEVTAGFMYSSNNDAICLNGTILRLRDNNFLTFEEWKQATADCNVVYPLATPIVVYAQNTAEIPTIQGDNNAFCDTGNIDIDYILSVDKYIQNQQ